jgi:Flp pilus assembly protein TadG
VFVGWRREAGTRKATAIGSKKVDMHWQPWGDGWRAIRDIIGSLRFRRLTASGQSVVEFALVVPMMILIVVAIADFGRMYVSAVAVEASAREAADFGSFHSTNWATTPIDNRTVIVQQMERRACTSAAGSHLEGYAEPAGTVGHATCTNPTFSYTLEPDNATCPDPTTDPSCVVHVHLDYTFRTLFAFPLIPNTIQIGRDSRFRMQDLVAPPPAP